MSNDAFYLRLLSGCMVILIGVQLVHVLWVRRYRSSGLYARSPLRKAEDIEIQGVSEVHWHICPGASGVIDLELAVRGRRFVARLDSNELPIVKELLADIADNRSTTDERINLTAAFKSALGRDALEAVESKRSRWRPFGPRG